MKLIPAMIAALPREVSGLVKGWAYGAAEFLSVQDYRNVQRWADTILARPAVRRGRRVNRTYGDPAEQLRERHEAEERRASHPLRPPQHGRRCVAMEPDARDHDGPHRRGHPPGRADRGVR